MKKIAGILGFAADLAPGATILALGLLLMVAGVIPGALLR